MNLDFPHVGCYLEFLLSDLLFFHAPYSPPVLFVLFKQYCHGLVALEGIDLIDYESKQEGKPSKHSGPLGGRKCPPEICGFKFTRKPWVTLSTSDQLLGGS